MSEPEWISQNNSNLTAPEGHGPMDREGGEHFSTKRFPLLFYHPPPQKKGIPAAPQVACHCITPLSPLASYRQ
jgi:hypothetical protein